MLHATYDGFIQKICGVKTRPSRIDPYLITLIKKSLATRLVVQGKQSKYIRVAGWTIKWGFLSFFLSFIDQADESHRFGTVRAVGKYQQTGYVQQTSPLVHGQGATRELY